MTEQTFVDLSLTVKSQFDNVYNDSLEKCLNTYFKIEMLEGDNKYACSICNEKTEATKGCRFNSLPNILTLHLKRFDLDYETF